MSRKAGVPSTLFPQTASLTIVDHCGTYGEYLVDGDGRRNGRKATTCAFCREAISVGRFATAEEIQDHLRECGKASGRIGKQQ